MIKNLCMRWALLLMGATAVASCSKKDTGPTDDEIIGLASKAIHVGDVVDGVQCGNVPQAAKLVRIGSVTVKERGIYNDQVHYWPVKADVKATCKGPSFTKPGQASPEQIECECDSLKTLIIVRDDFGKYAIQ